jgi:hypothetical protein
MRVRIGMRLRAKLERMKRPDTNWHDFIRTRIFASLPLFLGLKFREAFFERVHHCMALDLACETEGVFLSDGPLH